LLEQVALPETLPVFEPAPIQTLKSFATHQPHPSFSVQEEQLVLAPHSVGVEEGVIVEGVIEGVGSVQESLTLVEAQSPLPVHLKEVVPALLA